MKISADFGFMSLCCLVAGVYLTCVQNNADTMYYTGAVMMLQICIYFKQKESHND